MKHSNNQTARGANMVIMILFRAQIASYLATLFNGKSEAHMVPTCLVYSLSAYYRN